MVWASWELLNTTVSIEEPTDTKCHFELSSFMREEKVRKSGISKIEEGCSPGGRKWEKEWNMIAKAVINYLWIDNFR